MASHCYSHPFSFPLLPFSYLIMLLISLDMAPCVNSFDYLSSCSRSFRCGNVMNVGFPFWGDGRPEGCGYPELYLSCTASLTYLTIKNSTYLVKEVDPDSHSLKIARVEFLKGLCPDRIPSTTLDILYHNLFDYIPDYQNLTLLYGCNVTGAYSNLTGPIECPLYGAADKYAYAVLDYEGPIPGYCKDSVVVPVSSKLSVHDPAYWKEIEGALEDGFEVKWIVGIEECNQCQQSGGVCGYDLRLNQETCFCKGSDSGSRNCYAKGSSGKLNGKTNIAIYSSAGGTGIVIIIIALIVCSRKKCFRKRGTPRDDNVKKFMEGYGSSAPRRYTYSQVKRMTNSFANKLGEGGYGIVYKARLPLDGHPVAVKLLTESKGNGEEFINEVASIGRTSHVNIISLLGFCYEGDKRALIYEFMSNGSLDKFIYKTGSLDAMCNLEGKTMYQIASLTLGCLDGSS